MPISYIPIGDSSQSAVSDKPVNGRPSTDGSRVKRAKDLHDKVGHVVIGCGVVFLPWIWRSWLQTTNAIKQEQHDSCSTTNTSFGHEIF